MLFSTFLEVAGHSMHDIVILGAIFGAICGGLSTCKLRWLFGGALIGTLAFGLVGVIDMVLFAWVHGVI